MIVVNIEKAKEVAHALRREKRAEEFAPFDKIISLQIPGPQFTEAEAKREAIRKKYDAIQAEIDGANSVNELEAIIARL